MKSSGPMLLGATVILAAIGLTVWTLRPSSRDRVVDQNRFMYDVSRYREVDPGLMCGRESLSIPVSGRELHAVAVDAEDRIYVAADTEVIVWAPDGRPLSRFPLETAATCLAVAADGRILIGMRDHVEVYASDGVRGAAWASVGARAFITSVAVRDEAVWVADAGNRCVWRYDLSGALKGRLSGFVVPSPLFDVALASDGSGWVVDPGRLCVKKFTSDGQMTSMWGKAAMEIDGFCGCCNPSHIALRADGSFVTSEKGLARVKLYSADGALLGVVAAPDDFREGVVGLDLAVDSAGRILVLDPSAGAVRVFEEKPVE